MIEEAQVRARLAALANGELSLEEFERWIVSESWNMHADSQPEAVELVSSIHLLLSEYDHGDLSEPELRAELASLVPESPVIRLQISAPGVIRAPEWALATSSSEVLGRQFVAA